MKTIHLIFKTHLDIGFTDLARRVVSRYFEFYIPGAMKLARQLREEGSDERFIWTTGSWLIYEYLERSGAQDRKRMERAIAAGDIVWHALPFTTHSELMSPRLFRAGLSLASTLDRRFGRRTIAAKMTDIPGHTLGIVPLLAEAGVHFLHIGVNYACAVPEVPRIFRWRAPGGSEVVVGYSPDYGSVLGMKGFAHALDFAHTGDNLGPPPAEDIRTIFDRVCKAHPGWRVGASTLDAFAAPLWKIRHRLPLVTQEIGDTWIYGMGSDPRKVAEYRAFLRLFDTWAERSLSRRLKGRADAAERALLMVPEHTWGMDEKTHLGDYRNYSNRDFARARKRNLVPESAVPAAYKDYKCFFPWRANRDQPRSYSLFESSWQEQRDYLSAARKELAGTPLAAEADAALRDTRPVRTRPVGRALDPAAEHALGCFRVRFDPAAGAVIGLVAGGKGWCSPRHPVGLFRYQTFSQADFDRWVREYTRDRDKHGIWIVPDLTKPGMDAVRPRPVSAMLLPSGATFLLRREQGADTVVVRAGLPAAACRLAGAPREVVVTYRFAADEARVEITLQWFEKQATRLPEAAWFSFQPHVAEPGSWQVNKLGQWISPMDVAEAGNQILHAVGSGVRYAGPDGRMGIDSLDAPLVAPGDPLLIRMPRRAPRLKGGMHFNLHNNLFGSNFPMWFGEDARFRFVVKVGTSGALKR